MTKIKLSIILPAKNEEEHIKKSITEISGYLKKKPYSFEIIVVVNGSTDQTENIVRTLSVKEKAIKLFKSKAGYGYALRKGLKESQGDFIIIFNVDFYDMRLIDLVDINLYGKDLIIGSKRAHWSDDNRPIMRKLVSFSFNLYLKFMHSFKGSDTHGIKAIKKQVVKTILPQCTTYSGIFDTELVLRAQKGNFKIADFPVEVKEVRPSRFRNRLFQTPIDVYALYKSLK